MSITPRPLPSLRPASRWRSRTRTHRWSAEPTSVSTKGRLRAAFCVVVVLFRFGRQTADGGHESAFPRHDLPEALQTERPDRVRGRRECRVQAAPARLACKESALCARKQQQGSQNNRHSLRDGLRLIRGLLGVPGLLASVACRSPARLIPASGDRDRTISLVRTGHARLSRPARPSHPVSNVCGDWPNAPLAESG